MTPDFFDDYFDQVQVWAVCKIGLFVEALMRLKLLMEDV